MKASLPRDVSVSIPRICSARRLGVGGGSLHNFNKFGFIFGSESHTVWWVLRPGPGGSCGEPSSPNSRPSKSCPSAMSLVNNPDFYCPRTPCRLHARSHGARVWEEVWQEDVL